MSNLLTQLYIRNILFLSDIALAKAKKLVKIVDCSPVPNVLRFGTAGEGRICHMLAHDKAHDYHVSVTCNPRDTLF